MAGLPWRTSAVAAQKGNVGSELPHRVFTGALTSGAMRREAPFSRPQNGRSTGSLHPESGKATGTQLYPVREATGATSSKATRIEVSKALGAHLLHHCDLDMGHDVKGDYPGVLRFNDCPARCLTCMGHIDPFFLPTSPFWNGHVYPNVCTLIVFLESIICL